MSERRTYHVELTEQLDEIDAAIDLLETFQGVVVDTDASGRLKTAPTSAAFRRSLLEAADRLDHVATGLRRLTWEARK